MYWALAVNYGGEGVKPREGRGWEVIGFCVRREEPKAEVESGWSFVEEAKSVMEVVRCPEHGKDWRPGMVGVCTDCEA